MPRPLNLSREDEKKWKAFFKKKEDEVIKALNLVVKHFKRQHKATTQTRQALDKDRNSSPISFYFIEMAGGATFPAAYLMNDSKKELAALEKAVKSRIWKKVPKLVKLTELRINRYRKATADYMNAVSSGSSNAIFCAKFAQGAGMAATAALCTTFAAPAVIARLGFLGLTKGSLSYAASHAAAGAVIATQIKGVASGAGKLLAGEKIDPYKSGMAQLEETVEAGIFAFIVGGPTARFINMKTAKYGIGLSEQTFSILRTGANGAELGSRTAVAAAKNALLLTWEQLGSKKARAISRGVSNQIRGGENIERVHEFIVKEAIKDSGFRKRLQENLKRQMANKKGSSEESVGE